MLTLTHVDLQYDTNISSWDIWSYVRPLMTDLLLFQLATRLNKLNTYESEIHNDIWHY